MVKHGRDPPQETKINSFKYFNKNEKTGKTSFLYDIMITDLMENNDFITFMDTENTWVYEPKKGIYSDFGVPLIKQFMMNTLGPLFKKTYAEECVYQMRIKTYVKREDMEPDPTLLNLENGILDLNTLTQAPHSKDFFFINCLPTTYDPEAQAPLFKGFLEDIECPKLETLQEFSGYLLLNAAKYKKAGFLYGPTDSGKSTFSNAIAGVIGPESICSIPIQRLDARFQIQRLYQKRTNIVGDLGTEAFSKVSLFKRTTGGDILEAEIKGANKTMKFFWGGKHLFDANDLPNTEGAADSEAFYNRLLLFPFTITFAPEKIDRNFGAKLNDPTERSGILNWMIEGLQRLEENHGFTDKTSSSDIREHYKRASDTVYCFATDECEVNQGYYVSKAESREKYVEYCLENNFSDVGRSKFYGELKDNLPGIRTDRAKIGSGTPQVWMNLTIIGVEQRQKGSQNTL